MLSLEKRAHFAAIFDYVVRSEGIEKKIEDLLSARYEAGRQTYGESFPLPPSDMRDQPRDVVVSWQTTWTHAHEIVCAAAREGELLGRTNVYLSANRLWRQAVERIIESNAPVRESSVQPSSPPQLRLIHCN